MDPCESVRGTGKNLALNWIPNWNLSMFLCSCWKNIFNVSSLVKVLGIKRNQCRSFFLPFSSPYLFPFFQVTVIPTFESPAMQEWYQQTQDRQKELGITVLGSNSTVAMQDETFPACKIEFWGRLLGCSDGGWMVIPSWRMETCVGQSEKVKRKFSCPFSAWTHPSG